MKIVIFGLGYVGSSLAVLLSRRNDIYVTDLDSSRTEAISHRKSPIGDSLMEKMLQEENLNLTVSSAPEVLFPGADYVTEEAEAIKLFSNSYLATRIAFFNQLDSFATSRGLSTEDIIRGVCLDARIGDWYNVPGPGYGGACLPKDIAQLTADFGDLPESLLKGVIKSNELRKEFVGK